MTTFITVLVILAFIAVLFGFLPNAKETFKILNTCLFSIGRGDCF